MSAQSAYFPPAGSRALKQPAQLGLDPVKLAAAIAWAQAHETARALDFSDQETTFGTRLGSMPTRRAHTNGLVIYKGFVVAEFGDTAAVDPTYSVAKSILATIAGVAVRDSSIPSVTDQVGKTVVDGGYAGPNAGITWQHHLQQESEWQGSLWGKNADFIGAAAFGAGERKPRAPVAPGTFFEYNDVRINRFALSLLRVFDQPASVSGGTRWGGGMWIDSWDMARLGYLWLRQGAWNGKRIVPAAYVGTALTHTWVSVYL